MPMPDQAPAAEEEAAEPAQDQAAEAAAEEEKDYKALYEEALAQSRFDYQSVRHCSKTVVHVVALRCQKCTKAPAAHVATRLIQAA